MRISFFILGLLFFVACRKDSNSISVSGLYTEKSPVEGRSQLHFISSTLLVRSETGSNNKDTFNFEISSGKIVITPTWTNQFSGQQFDFEKIDENTIKIQNLYPSIPEAAKSYMIFKK
jgi:hypothetical protein